MMESMEVHGRYGNVGSESSNTNVREERRGEELIMMAKSLCNSRIGV